MKDSIKVRVKYGTIKQRLNVLKRIKNVEFDYYKIHKIHFIKDGIVIILVKKDYVHYGFGNAGFPELSDRLAVQRCAHSKTVVWA